MTRRNAFAVYGVPLVLIVAIVSTVQALSTGWRDGFPDFAIFTDAARTLSQGGDPYVLTGPTPHPPIILALLEPLAFPSGAVVFAVLSLGCGVVAAWWISREIGLSYSLLVLLLASLQPVALTIRQGQLSLVLMLPMTAAWLADRHGRSGLAGLLVGFVAIDKPFYALVGLYWIWRKDWTAVCSACLAGIAAIVVSVAWFGLELHLQYLRTLAAVNWQAEIVNASIPGLASRLFLERPYPFLVQTSPLLVSTLLARLTVAVLAALVLVIGRTGLRTLDQAWATVSVAALLLSPLGWIYYVPISAGPILSALRGASPRVQILIWVGGAMPFAVLAGGAPYGPLATLLVGNWYLWTLALLYWGVRGAADRGFVSGGTEASQSPTIGRSLSPSRSSSSPEILRPSA